MTLCVLYLILLCWCSKGVVKFNDTEVINNNSLAKNFYFYKFSDINLCPET